MASNINANELITTFAQDNSNIPALQFILSNPEQIHIEHLVDHGMVNYIFRVSSKDKTQSIIIKYGEECMRMAPTEKVSLDRQVLEYDCLQLLHSTHPGSVPEPYCFDRNHNAMAMQDMKGWDLLETQLLRQQIDLETATYLGEQLAKIHKCTTREAVGEAKWQEMVAKFSQDELKEYLGNLMYVRVFEEHDKINMVPEVCLDRYRACVRHVKQLGLEKKMHTLFDTPECFIHADCHWKAIFVKEGRTVLFDFEFAFLSHPAANLAFPATAYLFYYILLSIGVVPSPSNSPSVDVLDLKTAFEKGARHLVDGYLNVLDDGAESKRAAFLSEVALFTGGTLFMFSVFSFLHIFCDAPVHDHQRAAMMEAAYRLLITHHNIGTVDQLISAMFEK